MCLLLNDKKVCGNAIRREYELNIKYVLDPLLRIPCWSLGKVAIQTDDQFEVEDGVVVVVWH